MSLPVSSALTRPRAYYQNPVSPLLMGMQELIEEVIRTGDVDLIEKTPSCTVPLVCEVNLINVGVGHASGMRDGPAVIACIPAHNEEDTIGHVVSEARKYVDLVVVCDDGSTDSTYKTARSAGAVVVRHRSNLGYGAALRTLFQVARKLDPDVMVTLDGDGQHDPRFIPRLIKPVLAGRADIVVGSRFLGQTEMPAYRGFGVKVITWPVRLAAYPTLRDAQSGFRAYSRRAIHVIRVTEPGMGASTEILLRAAAHGLRLEEVPVRINYAGIAPRTSPIKHGLSVLLTTVKWAIRKHLGTLEIKDVAGEVPQP